MRHKALDRKDVRRLVSALTALQGEEEMTAFLSDLLTESELCEFSNRFKAAAFLIEGKPYKKIEEMTGLSSTTIARISKWLKDGPGGYRAALSRIAAAGSKHHHGA